MSDNAVTEVTDTLADTKLDEGNVDDERTDNQEITDSDQKHPLHNNWTMFYNPPLTNLKGKAWTAFVKPVYTFATVEDFWCLFNNLNPPSELKDGSGYHMFKNGIQPLWEDTENKVGGKWTVTFNHQDGKFNDAWLWALLALIGEHFDDSDDVNGVVVSPRQKQSRIALWTKTAANPQLVERIGRAFKRHIQVSSKLTFKSHDNKTRMTV